jgi:hypothetical protein
LNEIGQRSKDDYRRKLGNGSINFCIAENRLSLKALRPGCTRIALRQIRRSHASSDISELFCTDRKLKTALMARAVPPKFNKR